MTSIIDSCIGGKTGINYKNIINSVGNYYHANSVFIYYDIINKLPDREYFSGFPEIVKCGLLKKKRKQLTSTPAPLGPQPLAAPAPAPDTPLGNGLAAPANCSSETRFFLEPSAFSGWAETMAAHSAVPPTLIHRFGSVSRH